MAYVWQRWLADELRAAGLEVIEVEGWENRGRPASTGSFDPDGQHSLHHTGATSSASNPAPGISTLIQGRSDLPGPLCQYAVDYLGRVWIIAAGRANHAGPIGKSGVPGMPLGADGNALAIGDEVITNGTQALPKAQRESMTTAAAVVLAHFDRGPEYAHRHADISGSGKWDLGQLTTTQHRADVRAALTRLEFDMPLNKADIATIRSAVREEIAAAVAPLATRELLNRRSKAERLREQRALNLMRAMRAKLVQLGADVTDIDADLEQLSAQVAAATAEDDGV